MLRLSRFLRALPSTCAVLVAGAAALTSGHAAFAKSPSFGASSSSHVRERTDFNYTDALVRVGLPPLSSADKEQLQGGFTNLLGSTTPLAQGWRLIQNNAVVTFSFRTSNYFTTEGSGSVTLTVDRVGNPAAATVLYTTVDGNAVSTSDYNTTSGTLRFAAGQMSQDILVTIKQDTPPVFEGTETFSVSLSNAQSSNPGVKPGVTTPSTAVIQIDDDDSAIQFDTDAITVNESARTVSLPLRRNASNDTTALANAATVTLTTQDGSATSTQPNADFTAQNGITVTFPVGVATKIVTVPIISDTLDENDENFTVTLSNPASPLTVLLGTPAKTTVTITDDDDTTVSIQNPTYTASESGGNRTINVVRNGSTNDISRPLSVDYSTSGNTATEDVDYTGQSGTINFAAGETTKTITIPIISDTIPENNETFFVTLSNVVVDGNGAPLITGKITPNSTATVTIVDDDPSFNFTSATYSFSEGIGTASVVVTRSLAVNTAATVNYNTTSGSAAAGSDFISASGTLSFAAGQRQATIPITIIDDDRDETNETFTVTLSGATAGFTTGPQDTTIVTILDNDPPPTLSVENVSAREGNLVDGITQQRFTVTLSKASNLPITVDYATADGTATVADSDYIPTSGTLTIPAGAASATINVRIVDDSKFEDNEAYVLILSNPTNSSLLTNRATGTILNVAGDDDPTTSSFDFVNTSVSASELDANATLTVRRTGNTTTAATVTLTTADGTAISGADYVATTTILSFPANPNNTPQTQTTTVPILDDTVNEATETFTATLGSPTAVRSVSTVSTTDGIATVSILDNDPIPSVTVDSPSVVEGDNGTTNLVFTATLSAASAQTISLDYATADGTATVLNNDYVATSGTLTFAPGDTTQTITVAVNGDTDIEPNETLTLNLGAPQNVTLGTNQTTGTITNDDTPLIIGALTFDSDSVDPTVSEASGSVVLTVTRSQGADRPATVDYTTSDGTATSGSDYTATSGTLTFAVNQTSATITVPIADDNLKEDSETFAVTLSNPSNNVTLPATPTTTVTIADNEGTPTLSISDTQVAEGDSGTVSMFFTLSLQPQSQNRVTVRAATVTGGTASATASSGSPQDYRATSANFTFAPGESTKRFTVVVFSDTLVEPDETVIAELSNASGAPLGQSKATGTITNDDVPGGGGTIAFLSPTYSVNESAGTATVTLGRSGNVDMLNQQSASVRVTTGQGTATAGQDYRAFNSIVTFAAGETVKSFTIPIINDTAFEQNETVPMTLSNPSNNAILGTQTQATLTISDDDPVSPIPRADTLTPNNPSGKTFTVTSTYSSDRGASGLSTVFIQFAGDSKGGGFRAIYTPSTNKLSLDTGTQTGTPGVNRLLTNQFGTLDCGKTTVARSGNTISVTWTITLAFTRSQSIYLGATSPSGESVFVKRGTWTPASPTIKSSVSGS